MTAVLAAICVIATVLVLATTGAFLISALFFEPTADDDDSDDGVGA